MGNLTRSIRVAHEWGIYYDANYEGGGVEYENEHLSG